ncbi:MAG: hypothetical protein NUV35_08955, partial [Syntrophomonadaceae bacterium]|nr:hypothetical protein [Syntrophomonadaceae bacterium]
GPVTFRELYELLWQTNEQAYVDLFKTESFARLLAATMDAQVRFKMKAEELLGSFLESMSIPARKEMDSLYRSVYQVKKAVKEQARAIEELRSLLNGQKGGAAQQ